MLKCKSPSKLVQCMCPDLRSYVWWARKAENTGSAGAYQDPILDDELLETDEEDQGHAAPAPAAVTNVPLPTATDMTQASVDQLSALAVSSKDDEEPESKEASTPNAPTSSQSKDLPALPAS
jgi:hypothetical protein